MKKIILILLFVTSTNAQKTLLTPFEKGNGNQSATYIECIQFYKDLAKEYPNTISVEEKGITDSGLPLHVITYKNKTSDKKIINVLINNGIHPGEPDGIDASMLLARDLAIGKIKIPNNLQIHIIAVYNVDGMLNRSSTSRANQNGPEAYGFRGNARNYDLNRDFIKSDTKNSRSFQSVFHSIKPDIFIDNHVSNGADYQYTFTCIATQHERLGNTIGKYFKEKFYPEIVKDMNLKKIDVSPYVNFWGSTPESGFEQFADTPRYATGYTTLFHTLGFVPETHMLKKYSDRVKVTYEFMVSTIKQVSNKSEEILKIKNEGIEDFKKGREYPLTWKIDSTKVSYIDFKGFEANYKQSEVSGKNRLYYDRAKPFTKKIPFYANYKAKKSVTIPSYYIVPQSQWEIIELLKLNNIQLNAMQKDSLIEVESYKIKSFETGKNPYEGHYGHYNTEVEKSTKKIFFRKGDLIINTNQFGVKYLLETLEPEAVDSFFNWNFFDTILQQKEGYSAYVFEDLASKILQENPNLKEELESLKTKDIKFAESGAAQLDWVYKHSPFYEKEHMQYPIYRIK
jgi:hypothetical protein